MGSESRKVTKAFIEAMKRRRLLLSVLGGKLHVFGDLDTLGDHLYAIRQKEEEIKSILTEGRNP